MQLLVKKPSFLPQLVYDTIREAWEEEGDLIARFTTKTWQERLTSRMFTHSRDPQTGLSLLIQTDQEKQMQEVDWECCWVNARCPGLTPTQQSFLFKMVHGLLPFNERLLKFGLSQNNHCNFCGQKDDSCHFLQCQQASGMGSQIRSFLQEATMEQKDISWLHLRVLFFNLHPTLRLPAMVLTAELGLLATHCRKRSKKLEPACLISTIRSRGKALGRTRKFQQASQVLLDWAREAVQHPARPQRHQQLLPQVELGHRGYCRLATSDPGLAATVPSRNKSPLNSNHLTNFSTFSCCQ